MTCIPYLHLFFAIILSPMNSSSITADSAAVSTVSPPSSGTSASGLRRRNPAARPLRGQPRGPPHAEFWDSEESTGW